MIRLFIFMVIATFAAGHAKAADNAQDGNAQEERYAAVDISLQSSDTATRAPVGTDDSGVLRYQTPSSMRYEINGRDIDYSEATPVRADGAPKNLRPESWSD